MHTITPHTQPHTSTILTPAQRRAFDTDGYVHLPSAFATSIAQACTSAVWDDLAADPHDSRTWRHPVVHVSPCNPIPFHAAATSPRLVGALDDLLGPANYQPRRDLGNVVVRFPYPEPTRDSHWHIDASYPAPTGPARDYGAWHVNHHSTSRSLLLITLLTDTGPDDAPTRLRPGSHTVVPGILEPYGDAGVDTTIANSLVTAATAHLPTIPATGRAGDVYLCHPFLVHAAQDVAGSQVRIMAQAGIAPLPSPAPSVAPALTPLTVTST